MKRIKIAVLDSGMELTHPALNALTVKQFVYSGERWIEQSYEPKHGHGTAIASILAKNAGCFDIHSFVLFEEKPSIKPERYVSALENIACSEEHFDIIHMSLGVRYYNKKLEELCSHLQQKGTLLVSAFDNAGAVSFPAALSSVIGVDASFRCQKSDDFVFVCERGPVNLKAKGGNQRVAWLNNSYTITQGSSFAAVYITAHIIKFLQKDVPPQDVLLKFREKAVYAYEEKEAAPEYDSPEYFPIWKAVVFPCNKESYSVLRFSDTLKFDIVDVFDTKLSGNLGKKINDFNAGHSFTVKNISDCSWAGFDTFILGHTHDLEYFSQDHVREGIVAACLEKGINLFSFDDEKLDPAVRAQFEAKGLKVYYPTVNADAMPDKQGKMYSIQTPVLGVIGTSKQQGKFTLQLQLRKRFLRDGYKIGQLGTEPESLLFGMDFVYPFGYRSMVTLDNQKSIEYLNHCMFEMDKQGYNIIMVGSQAGTIPMMFTHIENYPLDRMSFLFGTRPDAVILCINYHDKIEDIIRSVRGIESLIKCKVIACSLFLMGYKNEWDLLRGAKSLIETADLDRFREKVIETIAIPCFTLDDTDGPEKLYQASIDFFSN